MILGADLYSILAAYSNKNNSPHIKIDPFLNYLGKSAAKYSADYPAWNRWTANREVNFWAEMSNLVEEGKCELIPDSESGQIFMCHYYPELLNNAYRNTDDDADMPFPNEQILGITVPEKQIRHLTSESGILAVLNDTGESDAPILKINFPDDFSSALVPVSMIPRELTEMAILKVRNYLKRYGNKEYIFHKLLAPLQGKDSFLKDQLDQILIRPMDTYNSIKDGRELSYLFWAHFCSLAKNEIKRKQDRLPSDIAAFQSFSIIDEVSAYFKELAIKRRETELAFKNLENRLAQPPFRYSMGQVLKFTDPNGKLLSGQYTNEELEEWLRNQTTENKNNEMPNLLVIKGASSRDRYFALKSKMPALCSMFLIDARAKINDGISRQWSRLLLDHKKTAAMDNDGDFERLLARLARSLSPEMVNFLQDSKLPVVYQELEKTPNTIPTAAKVFNKGQLLPYSTILALNRRDLLQDARLVLPFWYSIPIISAIIAFFKNLSKKKKRAGEKLSSETDSGEEIIAEISVAEKIRAAAEGLELVYVPSGFTIDSYLKELESRWARLIDTKARENLIEDVQHLLDDNMRRVLKIDKRFDPTQEGLGQMAYNLVVRNPALASLGARDSLLLYMELYMIKLLETIKLPA